VALIAFELPFCVTERIAADGLLPVNELTEFVT
jgi:hypothetical protein